MAAGARIIAGLAVAAVATLLVSVIWLAEPDPPATAPGPPEVARVGLIEGQSVDAYLRASRAELATLTRSAGHADVWALVTLASYVPPDRLTPMLAGVGVAEVYARAPLPGPPTAVVRIPAYRVPGDVISGMLATAVLRDHEAAYYRQLSARVTGDTPNDARLRRAYTTAAAVAGAEARAYRAHCSCVVAAVVRATPAALTGLAARAGVRGVDPAPEVTTLDRAEFRPLLPEQPSTPPAAAAPQETRTATGPAPNAARPVAPATSTPVPSSLGAHVTSASSDEPRTGSGPSAPASEEHAAVPSAPARGQGRGAPTATAGASGR
jgi:hypothetical protein